MTGAVESPTSPTLHRLRHAADASPDAPAHLAPDRLFHVDADFSHDSTWSGVRNLVEAAYLELLEAGHSELLERHHYELYRVLPQHRDRIFLKHACLTDTANGSERTRNFPLDRAYRLVHGLVGLLLEWKRLTAPDRRWVVVVEHHARAQHLAARFFAELARRGARDHAFEVLVDGVPDGDLEPAGMRASPTALTLSSLGLSPLPAPNLDDDVRETLERQLQGNDILAWEEHYPHLLAYYGSRGDVLARAGVAMRALCICNHYGYYHESASFADMVLPHLDTIVGDDENARWNYIGNLFQGIVTTGAEQFALDLLLTHAEPRLSRPDIRARMHYLLSMAYLRYTRTPDLSKAEEHILQAAASIDAAKPQIAAEDYSFLKVFIDNGLAFLRVRQGRQAEALSLCQSGYALLTHELGDERHRLHRSVLQYNTAQVYAMLNRGDDALEHYRKSIEMDPYYSEYYNEVGNILQRAERYEEAHAMYDLAIEYSAPYPEVHYNRGVCLVAMGRADEALACFVLSLELNPAQPELLALRAELREADGDIDGALEDYDNAIALAPQSVPARVNRAVLHYGGGRYHLALADMDQAIALEPAEAGHYLNRAEIHKAMAQRELYQRDLAAAEACEAAA